MPRIAFSSVFILGRQEAVARATHLEFSLLPGAALWLLHWRASTSKCDCRQVYSTSAHRHFDVFDWHSIVGDSDLCHSPPSHSMTSQAHFIPFWPFRAFYHDVDTCDIHVFWPLTIHVDLMTYGGGFDDWYSLTGFIPLLFYDTFDYYSDRDEVQAWLSLTTLRGCYMIFYSPMTDD